MLSRRRRRAVPRVLQPRRTDLQESGQGTVQEAAQETAIWPGQERPDTAATTGPTRGAALDPGRRTEMPGHQRRQGVLRLHARTLLQQQQP